MSRRVESGALFCFVGNMRVPIKDMVEMLALLVEMCYAVTSILEVGEILVNDWLKNEFHGSLFCIYFYLYFVLYVNLCKYDDDVNDQCDDDKLTIMLICVIQIVSKFTSTHQFYEFKSFLYATSDILKLPELSWDYKVVQVCKVNDPSFKGQVLVRVHWVKVWVRLNQAWVQVWFWVLTRSNQNFASDTV